MRTYTSHLILTSWTPARRRGLEHRKWAASGYEELRECLMELVAGNNLVGFDMVEVAPPYDSSEITAQVAARLIIDILTARFPAA